MTGQVGFYDFALRMNNKLSQKLQCGILVALSYNLAYISTNKL